MGEGVARQTAFHYYYTMELNNRGQRSLGRLLKSWSNQVREDASNRLWVPTLDANVLSKWSQEDRWHERAAALDQAASAEYRERVKKHRKMSVDMLSAYLVETIDAIQSIAMDPDEKAADRLKAIDMIWNRVGLIDQTKLPTAKRPDPKDAERESTESEQLNPTPPSVIADLSHEDAINQLISLRREE